MSTELATVQPHRYSAEQRQLILETCCGGASEHEAAALIGVAEARGMNPLAGECYFVKRWDGAKGKATWAVQASIDSFRIKAEQSGLYAGQDEPEFEYGPEGGLMLARVKVYRKDWGDRACVGVARWDEYVQTTKDGKPTRFWSQMPHNQLAKCAEALALRKAFPAALAKIYTAEEMAQAENEPVERTAPLLPAMAESAAGKLGGAETLEDLKSAWNFVIALRKQGLDDVSFVKLEKIKDLKKIELVGPPEPYVEREPGED